jgi:hypothetical protein
VLLTFFKEYIYIWHDFINARAIGAGEKNALGSKNISKDKSRRPHAGLNNKFEVRKCFLPKCLVPQANSRTLLCTLVEVPYTEAHISVLKLLKQSTTHQGAKTTQSYCLMILEATSSKSRCPQAGSF